MSVFTHSCNVRLPRRGKPEARPCPHTNQTTLFRCPTRSPSLVNKRDGIEILPLIQSPIFQFPTSNKQLQPCVSLISPWRQTGSLKEPDQPAAHTPCLVFAFSSTPNVKPVGVWAGVGEPTVQWSVLLTGSSLIGNASWPAVARIGTDDPRVRGRGLPVAEQTSQDFQRSIPPVSPPFPRSIFLQGLPCMGGGDWVPLRPSPRLLRTQFSPASPRPPGHKGT